MLAKVLRTLWGRLPHAAQRKQDPSSEAVDPFLAEGLARHKAGNLSTAEAAYAKALERNPDNPNALHLLGTLAYRRGDLDGAEDRVRRALALVPSSGECRNTLATVLSDMGRHGEAQELLEETLLEAPQALRARANLLFLLNIIPGISRDRLFAEHVKWASLHAPGSGDTQSRSLQDAADGRLRIGYVSADFFAHPVGRILCSVLEHHDAGNFEIFCYDNGNQRDAVNTALRQHAQHWIECAAMDDEALARRIRADGIQILVDLSGHTRKNRLRMFARKPAPVQATWLGYLNTTGMPSMDWRLTDERADPPPHSQQWHVERLCYLPRCAWPWSPPAESASATVTDLPAARNGYVTFGSFNTFRKINSEVIATWAELLRAVPEARLRVHGAPGGRAVDRVYDLFEAAGVQPERIDLFASIEYERYLLAYKDIDIALDPFPYNGGATTCESLWSGVPVITLAGSGGFARSGASILGAVGLQALVATTVTDYIRIAASLARNLEQLALMRNALRQKVLSSPLGDAEGFTRDLENAYRAMWCQWCEQPQARQLG